jgi:hypothetical protein
MFDELDKAFGSLLLVALFSLGAFFLCQLFYKLATEDAIEEQRKQGREVQWRR